MPEEDDIGNNEVSSTTKSYSSASFRSFPMVTNLSSSPNDSSVNSSEVTPRTPATLTGARTALATERGEDDEHCKSLSQPADSLEASVDNESISTAPEQMMFLP